MKKIRLEILCDWYMYRLRIIRDKAAELAKKAKGSEPKFHVILRDSKILFAEYITTKARAQRYAVMSCDYFSEEHARKYADECMIHFNFLLS